MSALPLNLVDTAGFLVADNRGRLVGKVECPMYGTLPDVPDAAAAWSRPTLSPTSIPPARSSASVWRARPSAVSSSPTSEAKS
jgi:hypothetical protein